MFISADKDGIGAFVKNESVQIVIITLLLDSVLKPYMVVRFRVEIGFIV